MKFKLIESVQSDAVKEHFIISDRPVAGPSYIMLDGSFIDICSTFDRDDPSYEDFPVHAMLDDYLYFEKELVDQPGDAGDGSYVAREEGWIRCNDIDDNNYVEVMDIKPTNAQYIALEDWLNVNSLHHETIIITTLGFKSELEYAYTETFPEVIIKRIKRYYASGNLYEKLFGDDRILKEWTDPDTGKEYFDYGTGEIKNPPEDIFDLTKTGMSFYDQLIPGHKENEYMRDYKNLEGKIVYMTPKQYYEECANKVFENSPVDNLLATRKSDEETINTIKEVIQKFKRLLPLCFIDYARHGQEGLHRMLAIAELFGWDCKLPVLAINWADPEYEKKRAEKARIDEIYGRIEGAVLQSLRYEYNDVEEFEEELLYHLQDNFQYYDEAWDSSYNFELSEKEASVKVFDVTYTFDPSEIKINDEPDDDIDWDDIEIDDSDLFK